ncbi:ferredoxin--NADP reductase [Actinocorallia sp. B10E7]|uniref:ferredoxin--NADP reductase n=1 Tax=Actinocorallia sp. B10E7 TaxID=3153558 RepID=UPI00325D4B6A
MARDHGFHPIRIKRIIQETADTRTYVLDAPFDYQAGQFLTFKVCGTLRSYSMSSSPATDPELTTTVKRVPGGLVSNWMHDNLSPGDLLEATPPAGVFCLRETSAPLVAFSGGSGITPVLSLVKTALAATDRRVRLLTADRDGDSIIFEATLAQLAERYPGRLEVRHHLDSLAGFLTEARVKEFAADARDADFYICGPEPFMDLVERALLAQGADPGQLFIERFGSGDDGAPGEETEGTVTIVLSGKTHTVPQHSGETLLQSARRAGLAPPFSCEAGNCATCIAQVTEGRAQMKINNALDEDEVADGWVLTCQGEPATPHLTVVYED